MLVYIIGLVVVLLGFFVILWCARKEPVAEELLSSGVQRGFKPFHRGSNWLCRKLHLPRPPDLITGGMVLLILLSGNITALTVAGVEYWKAQTPQTKLEKGDYDVPYEQTMKVQEEGKEEHIITIPIPGKTYSEQELDEMFTKTLKEMAQYILGANDSLWEIRENMDLVTMIKGTPIQVTWSTEQPNYLDWEGRLGNDIPENGVKVKLQGSLFCQGQTKEYIQIVKVFPPILSKIEKWKKKIQDAVKQKNENEDSPQLLLPDQIDGNTLYWFQGPSTNSFMVVGMAILLAVVLLVGRSREQLQEREKRTMQMMLDYPNILNKFILLLNAGMNMRKAFAKVALDYKKQKEQSVNPVAVRYGYEEILLTFYEMEKGVSEQDAYERLGARCSLPGYKTFSVLLVQNLKKGNKMMLEMMEREAQTAFQERKRRAKILGEQAGTKLLLPMGGMLVIVFAILLIPAFLNFSI